jgi:hypothetical protein
MEYANDQFFTTRSTQRARRVLRPSVASGFQQPVRAHRHLGDARKYSKFYIYTGYLAAFKLAVRSSCKISRQRKFT